MWLYVINKVKVTHQGEGHIKVKVRYLHPFKFYVAHALCKRVVCIRLKCYLFFVLPELSTKTISAINRLLFMTLIHIHKSCAGFDQIGSD